MTLEYNFVAFLILLKDSVPIVHHPKGGGDVEKKKENCFQSVIKKQTNKKKN